MKRVSRLNRATVLVIIATLAGASCSSSDTSASRPTNSSGSAESSPSTAPDSATAGQFGDLKSWSQVEGTDGREYIADADGRALQFRGTNIKTAEPAKDVTDELLAQIERRGFNHIRLSVYWSSAEPKRGAYEEQYLSDVDDAIARARSHGLWVIVDFHQDVFGPAFGDHGIPEWATKTGGKPFADTGSFLTNYLQPAVQEAWENLYEDPEIRTEQQRWYVDLVSRMQAHPNVLGYDLLNEPFGKIRDGEDLISAAARVESKQLTPMYQRLTDAIRTVDKDRWIFIEPPNLASLGVTTSLGKIDDARVVFYPHMYDISIEGQTYNGDGNPQAFDPKFIDTWSTAITGYTAKYAVPMMVGEWGVATPTNAGLHPFIANTVAELATVSSGWSHFNGCLGDGYCTFAPDGGDRPGIGQIVQPWVRAYGGTPTSSSWSPDDQMLRVALTANPDATTEIAVPPGIFADGFAAVSANGTQLDTKVLPQKSGYAIVNVRFDKSGPVDFCVTEKGATSGCTP